MAQANCLTNRIRPPITGVGLIHPQGAFEEAYRVPRGVRSLGVS